MSRPNVLLILVDQLRFPQTDGVPEHGFDPDLRDILGFRRQLADDNRFKEYFAGFLALREHAVVLQDHTIASSACIPSRATIMTGQYGTRTGVTQTDGLFKSGDAHAFPWLPPDGVPTMGHWFREAGYTTHYFGKWHVSNPPEHSLERYGFSDWELSYPEPHGAAVNNLGTYRDHGFADLVCAFLQRRALGLDYDRVAAELAYRDPTADAPDPDDLPPWFAVASFTNPHDIATYPALPRAMDPSAPLRGPLVVPEAGTTGTVPTGGTIGLDLNPLGMPQDSGHLPATAHDPLANKPRCQFDYAYKLGLGLAAKTGLSVGESTGVDPVTAALATALPFQTQDDPDDATTKFLQYYAYLIHAVDQHIARVLSTLNETGLRKDTLVVFASDHGEYGGSHHMMMEKWHTAYREALHVPVVFSAPHLNDGPPRHVKAPTSHVDLLPTLLGLVGVDADAREAIATRLRLRRPTPPLPGADLTPVVRGRATDVQNPDGTPREGVLFVTDDMITEPLPPDGDAHNDKGLAEFQVFVGAVDAVRGQVPRLAPGAVRQPNHVRCVRTARYKLARYWDPSGEHADEWELYDTREDPYERTNLLRFDGAFPTPAPGLDAAASARVTRVAERLGDLLTTLEATHLAPWPPA